MLKKKGLFLFIFYLLQIQHSEAQLPYSKTVKYNKKSEGKVIAKMLDDLGYKYYWVTDSLMNDELNSNFHTGKLPRLLLKDVYVISENIINSISNKQKQSKLKKVNISFNEIRKNTLLNLKEASNILINNKEALLFLNWNDFLSSIAYAHAYCDQIILFRNAHGNTVKRNDKFIKNKQKDSKVFNESLGADGLTNDQWMMLTYGGGGAGAQDRMRTKARQNYNTLIKLKKKEVVSIEVGDLEIIRTNSNMIEGVNYKHSNIPPKQLSFLYSNDDDLVKGLVDWVIYINSGYSVKLSDIFRVGLDDSIFIDASINKLFVDDKYRVISDKNKNTVILEFSDSHFDKTKFSDIRITKVIINHSLIRFFAETNQFNDVRKKGEKIIAVLRNIEGNLLNRINFNIDQTREGLNEYDDTIMNLSKY
ncbi:hypothetical protein [Yeosuana marina]|uniref:hypothetical protein n=1 Tax=Yeosuana marina TaxID=1565536 RepID=UPI00141FEFED|nr:hypothetical protein [Yeosuana marina]